MGPVEEVRITTFSFNRILRNGAYHLTTWRRLAEDWNPQLQIRGNLTTLTFENIIFINQLLPDTLHFIYLFIYCIAFQVWGNEAEDSSEDAGQESEESQKNILMDSLVCSIVTLARILFADYPATNGVQSDDS